MVTSTTCLSPLMYFQDNGLTGSPEERQRESCDRPNRSPSPLSSTNTSEEAGMVFPAQYHDGNLKE